jgi:protein phosphatase
LSILPFHEPSSRFRSRISDSTDACDPTCCRIQAACAAKTKTVGSRTATKDCFWCQTASAAFAGGLAARIVAESLPPLVRSAMHDIVRYNDPRAGERLSAAIAVLSHQIRSQRKGQPGLDGMSATVVLALIRDAHAIVAHLGDSRAYLARSGGLSLLTKDHSIIQRLIDTGEITPEQAADYPERGRLTRYVGMDAEPLPEAHALELHPGDRLLLCSDGLTSMLDDPTILAVLEDTTSAHDACSRLIGAANEAGGTDNLTAVVVAIPN